MHSVFHTLNDECDVMVLCSTSSRFYRFCVPLTLNDETEVMAGPACSVVGGASVDAGVASLDGRDVQGSVGEDAQVCPVHQRPPVPVPAHLRGRLPVRPTLQTGRLTQDSCELRPRDTQHWGDWGGRADVRYTQLPDQLSSV